MRLLITAAILTLWVGLVQSHGYLKDPIARTSIQLREAEFNTQQPYWWDNQGVWCGNVKQSPNYETCGRCGDAPGETLANQNGIYDKKVIVATYTAGSVSRKLELDRFSVSDLTRVLRHYLDNWGKKRIPGPAWWTVLFGTLPTRNWNWQLLRPFDNFGRDGSSLE